MSPGSSGLCACVRVCQWTGPRRRPAIAAAAPSDRDAVPSSSGPYRAAAVLASPLPGHVTEGRRRGVPHCPAKRRMSTHPTMPQVTHKNLSSFKVKSSS